jgi:hypothetical protein
VSHQLTWANSFQQELRRHAHRGWICEKRRIQWLQSQNDAGCKRKKANQTLRGCFLDGRCYSQRHVPTDRLQLQGENNHNDAILTIKRKKSSNLRDVNPTCCRRICLQRASIENRRIQTRPRPHCLNGLHNSVDMRGI